MLTLAACSKAPAAVDKNAASARPLLLSPEDLLTVANSALTSGPTITGTVQPERRADLRAEISAVVLQVLKENGDVVHRGDLLVRLDDTAIRDSLASADGIHTLVCLSLHADSGGIDAHRIGKPRAHL